MRQGKKLPEGEELFNSRHYQFSGVYVFTPEMEAKQAIDYTLLKDAYFFNGTCMIFNFEIPYEQMKDIYARIHSPHTPEKGAAR